MDKDYERLINSIVGKKIISVRRNTDEEDVSPTITIELDDGTKIKFVNSEEYQDLGFINDIPII